jgi:carbonic anhydrase
MMAGMTSSAELLRQARNQSEPLPRKPRRRTAVLACMDARVDPLTIAGAEVGDIHILRNAGAVVTTDVIRSLIASTGLLGVDRIMIMMHTDCGANGLTKEAVETRLGPVPYDMHGFTSLEDELRKGVERLRAEPLIVSPKGITGHVYDLATGQMNLVVP